MTSKISFSKLLRKETAQLSWLGAVQLVVYLITMPLVLVMMISNALNQGYYLGIAKDQVATAVFCDTVGFGQLGYTFIILMFGALSALVTFHYLHNAQQLDFYHSIPVKRSRLYLVKITAGMLVFLVPYLISRLLMAMIGCIYGVLSGAILLDMLLATLEGLLFFMASYAGALLAVMLTGKILTSVLALIVLAGYGPLLALVRFGLVSEYVRTMPADIKERGLTGLAAGSSIWMRIFKLCSEEELLSSAKEKMAAGREAWRAGAGNWSTDHLIIILVTLILFVACAILYQLRKTECAGKAISFKSTEQVIKLLLAVPSAILIATVTGDMMDSWGWALFTLILMSVLLSMFMELIYRWDIRQVFGAKLPMLISVLLAVMLYGGVQYAAQRYDTYCPEESKIEGMAILTSYQRHPHLQKDGDASYFIYGHVDEKMLEQVAVTDHFDKIYAAAQNGIQNLRYDWDFYEETEYVGILYILKNGKQIYREYNVSVDAYLDAIEQQDFNENMKAYMLPILTWEEDGLQPVEAEIRLDDTFLELVGLKADENGSLTEISAADQAGAEIETARQEETETETVAEPESEGNMAENSKEVILLDSKEPQWSQYTFYTNEAELTKQLAAAYRADLADIQMRDVLAGAFDERKVTDIYQSSIQFYIRTGDDMEYSVIADDYDVNEKYVHTLEVLKEILPKCNVNQALG